MDVNMDSVSYSLGVLVAQNLKQQGVEDINPEALARGVKDVLSNNDLEISVSACNQIVQEHMMKRQAEKYEDVVEGGRKFLEENAKREGVVELPSGLQYEIIQEGGGAVPKPGDKVTVHYTGKLLDGTVFDSSVERGEPATFGVTQVIQGWVEALQLMREGSKWRLYIPYDLAYGERGAGQQIGPYETLIFEVELLKVN